MQSSKTFGRRAVATPGPLPAIRKFRLEPASAPRAADPVAAQAASGTDMPARPTPTVEQEIEEWNEVRKIRRRSFREPWRSVSIVAGLAFVATSWMLPEDVANVAQIPLAILTIGSIYAGWRRRKPT